MIGKQAQSRPTRRARNRGATGAALRRAAAATWRWTLATGVPLGLAGARRLAWNLWRLLFWGAAALLVAARRLLWAVARQARRRPRAAAACLATGLLGAALWQFAPFRSVDALPRPVHRAGPDGLECLALNIYHEARGEPRGGKVAVAQVVMNRVADPRFPNEICAVVKQGGTRIGRKCQFSWWCDGRSDRPRDLAAWEDSKALARGILDGRHPDPTGGALWYHAESVRPKWGMAIVPAGKIGRHLFYIPAAAKTD